jgi:hypothetical protein
MVSAMKAPQIPPQPWIGNLLEAARNIADRRLQESRWLAPDRKPWESPDEAINTLDDCALPQFIETFSETFTAEQALAIAQFRDEVETYAKATPQHLEPSDVLADPRWESVRSRASQFVLSFQEKWPR